MPIHNEIFDTYRLEVKKIHNAIKLLAKQGYTIIDLEGQVITKWNVESWNSPTITYTRAPKEKYMNQKNKPKKVRTVDDILFNLNYHAKELSKILKEKKKWEEIIKKNSNERTYI